MATRAVGPALKTEAELERLRAGIDLHAGLAKDLERQLADLRERHAIARARKGVDVGDLAERVLAGEDLEAVSESLEAAAIGRQVADVEAQLRAERTKLEVLSDALARDDARRWYVESQPALEKVAEALPRLLEAFDAVEAALREARAAEVAFDAAASVGGGAAAARLPEIRPPYQAELLMSLFRRWRVQLVEDDPNPTVLDRFYDDVRDLIAGDPWLAATAAGKAAAAHAAKRLERRTRERNGQAQKAAEDAARRQSGGPTSSSWRTGSGFNPGLALPRIG